MARGKWRSMETAPRDGTIIEIRGRRFMRKSTYRALAVWATRACSAIVTDWFPPVVDREGPYTDVLGWRPR